MKKDHTKKVLRRAAHVVRDGLVLVGMYALALHLIDDLPITSDYVWNHATVFLALYISGSFAMQSLGLDFADSLSRGATVIVAAKFVTALAPPGINVK